MEEKGSVLELVISIFLGILPSFLIFSMFNQSNFSFPKYLTFLLDVSTSFLSWASIVFITVVVYYLIKKLSSKTKKFLTLFFILILLVAFVIAYLYANFILGNDVLVKISADKENLFFNDSIPQTITITISANMNPFCIAKCEYSLLDISTQQIIKSGEVSLNSILSTYQEYTFSNEGKLIGQGLNRFEISCKSKKTLLCYTKEEESKRAILITLNYGLSQEQKAINEISKEEIISLEKDMHISAEKLLNINYGISVLDNFTLTNEMLYRYVYLSNAIFILNSSLNNLKKTWISQEYVSFQQNLPDVKDKMKLLKTQEEELISLINSNISLYNDLAEKLNNSSNIITKISLENMSKDSCQNLNGLIAKFNEALIKFQNKSYLFSQESVINDIFSQANRIYELPEEQNGSLCSLNETLNEKIISKIFISYRNYTIPDFYLEDPEEVCCFYGKCEKCCDEKCSNKNYPVLFLHGHSFNKKTSADYSLDAFTMIKEKLTEEGYIDAGVVILSKESEQNGLWGKINAPIEVTGSYFFDVSKSETGQETIVPSKTDNIDTYALRLNDLVDTVKVRTGKEKVIVVAHSMGGLVTRRYLQIFENKNDIDRLILVNVPNHGIGRNIEKYCPLIGSRAECNDMEKDSLLINKLNNAKNISIPVYNIIGTGCNTEGGQGDGIISEFSQYLDYAENFYVKGSCNEIEFEFLHETILNPNKYPQTYEFIKENLK